MTDAELEVKVEQLRQLHIHKQVLEILQLITMRLMKIEQRVHELEDPFAPLDGSGTN